MPWKRPYRFARDPSASERRGWQALAAEEAPSCARTWGLNRRAEPSCLVAIRRAAYLMALEAGRPGPAPPGPGPSGGSAAGAGDWRAVAGTTPSAGLRGREAPAAELAAFASQREQNRTE